MTEPIVQAGIFTAPAVSVNFHGEFADSSAPESPVSGHITIDSGAGERTFTPHNPAGSWFELEGVTIGVDFHWERRENQRFPGALRVIPCCAGFTAINLVNAEDYLKSVISSEMNSHASPELLKAHAVISRSWLLAMLRRRNESAGNAADCADDRKGTPQERIQWWDREDHALFDVCADDHCQRYQGLARMTAAAVEAVEATRGMVLTHEGEICDARFSKCCGGAFERFENCWAPTAHPYLAAGSDTPDPDAYPDLTDEENARRWILGSPEAFCNTTDSAVLDQVLNNYDRETPDFYRWKVEYDAGEMSDLVRRRTGIDFGRITGLTPLRRGSSGRIVSLRIDGTRRSMVIGKELAIRRALSESHLYSSAFIVEQSGDGGRFTLHGAGWGHGVGLCQIGAAMMAHEGYSFSRILRHYYRGASIEKLY